MRQLLKKGAPFTWTSECEIAFESLKASLCELTSLHLPDMNRKFILQSDSSGTGVGCVLSQEHEGEIVPVWYASRAFTPPETRYSASEKECLGVIWSCKKFMPFIEMSHFVIETDCSCLTWLMSNKQPTGRLARWFMLLQGLKFDIVYRPGNSLRMRPADSLSRIHYIAFLSSPTEIPFVVQAPSSLTCRICSGKKSIKNMYLM